ncbi:MAG: S-methyl-5'-thioadenosine phosphorylase [Anaerolineae bacterium]|nr:S-methyl-5'-thioadenosine phosphorylase [Anaerolineae bacterium]NUQ02370.1 S-methyl-5'-thioadenosine phosphorylase [Anaerolineae bacterium]
MESVTIGVIGGSGLYKMPELRDIEQYNVVTPFGNPSAPVIVGTLRGKRIAFIPRHGIGHIFTPTMVPYRANIFALKMLGVQRIIGVNACGSLREDYRPGDIVIPDQIFDHTTQDRGRSFFDTGLVAHVGVADPFCAALSELAVQAVRAAGGKVHQGGTSITIEGPRFSTRGESNIYRQWGCSIIGMTTCPEAFLTREAEMCYVSMSHVTDYDVWHQEPVSVEMVVQTLHRNLTLAQQALANLVRYIEEDEDCTCHHALDTAIMTDREKLSKEALQRLGPILERFVP